MHLWIGGGQAAGKTSIARRLALRHDLRVYHIDHRTYTHEARQSGSRRIDWVRSTPSELAERFLTASLRRFELILEDLADVPDDRPTLVEGPFLRPHQTPDPAVWLIPSEQFQRARLVERDGRSAMDDDARTALANKTERNVLIAEVLAAEAGPRVIAVDGTETIGQVYLRVEAWFAPVLAALAPATSEQRWTLRRDANEWLWRQLTLWRQDEPDASVSAGSFACECDRRECDARTIVPLEQFADVAASRTPLIAHNQSR